ncbi:hypothetical protein Arnit_0867 [Arcobacter nitrofigilis DSM 7299]|uniref:Uncharacterized protein n=1 Tax=Arcobacter nitrofigilis (strain ATCC 33309 / DSM 7299 / CCUG 15893 / LMG 7604 / NCTC 12251 / CI) TaxID=572480 RepID=D5V2U9_ARCNC|nr:hypothetical protein [Arcobacter nitrofigilis]ADG92531.1 hypothetical protein Arnit_0867 [Arcobacter nitrofigilis DSM 7299]
MEEKESSNKGLYIIISLVIIVLVVAYILLPKSWANLGNTYKPRTVEKDEGPTPTSLQFRSPFKYDNYKPDKRIEPKRKEQGQKDKPMFWKE